MSVDLLSASRLEVKTCAHPEIAAGMARARMTAFAAAARSFTWRRYSIEAWYIVVKAPGQREALRALSSELQQYLPQRRRCTHYLPAACRCTSSIAEG